MNIEKLIQGREEDTHKSIYTSEMVEIWKVTCGAWIETVYGWWRQDGKDGAY